MDIKVLNFYFWNERLENIVLCICSTIILVALGQIAAILAYYKSTTIVFSFANFCSNFAFYYIS